MRTLPELEMTTLLRPIRVATFAILAATSSLILIPSTAPAQAPNDGKLGFTVQRDVMVPMRDGVKLATDVYLPTLKGAPVREKLPTILSRSPYNKERPGDLVFARYYATHGYAVVIQDTRGRFKS